MSGTEAPSTELRRGRDGRDPSRMWARRAAALAAVVMAVIGSSTPALGAPCDGKGSKKGPGAACKGADDDGPTEGTGKAHGSAKGKAHGNDGDAGAAARDGAHAGGDKKDHGGATGSESGGARSSRGRNPHERRDDEETTDGDGGGRSRTKSRRSASAPSSNPATQFSSMGSEATSGAPGGTRLATDADWDLAGPQLSSGDVNEAQAAAFVRDRRYLSTALTAAETLAFPMSLWLIVVAFLFMQAYIDRDDPKLKEAAVRREVYEFN